MDIEAALKELRAQKEALERAIAELEKLISLDGSKGTTRQIPYRRGRRFMAPAERQQVAERMKCYWAKRRSQKKSEARVPPGTGVTNVC